jgi:hypothetical protein
MNLSSRSSVPRDLQIENLKREVELLRAELDKMKLEVRECRERVAPTWAGQGPTLSFLYHRPSGTSHS